MADIYTNIDTDKLKDEAECLKKTLETEENGILLFISFDLVNSTELKIKNKEKWPAIIMSFYQVISSEIKEIIDEINIWKYLGDEIVFYYNIKNIEKIYRIPEMVYVLQEKVIQKTRDKFKIDKRLDIKCTLWLAGIRYVKSGTIQDFDDSLKLGDHIYRNIHISIDSKDNTVEDFLGPDIDIGFRIAKYSNKDKITLSAEFAYLLFCLSKPNDSDKIDKKLKIVSFKELKGVWEGRAYPIIWYYPNWDDKDNGFNYDEHINNDIINNISNKKDIDYLEKVFEETGKQEYIKNFIDACKSYNREEMEIMKITTLDG